MSVWTQAEAIELCRAVEAVAKNWGCHVALTGGCLYKDGARKDCDLLFYRHRQADGMEIGEMWVALAQIGLLPHGDGQALFCQKATYRGKPVDCLFPELGDEYPEEHGQEEPDPFRWLDGATQEPA